MENSSVVRELQVRYEDLNPNGHVSNTVYMSFFETMRLAYFKAIADYLDLGPLEAGELPEVRYVLAEATVRYKLPIFMEEPLYGTASIRTIGKRSYVMDYELRVGESFEPGRSAAEGSSVQVFYDLDAGNPQPRPEWFLSAVAAVEGHPEASFAP